MLVLRLRHKNISRRNWGRFEIRLSEAAQSFRLLMAGLLDFDPLDNPHAVCLTLCLQGADFIRVKFMVEEPDVVERASK